MFTKLLSELNFWSDELPRFDDSQLNSKRFMLRWNNGYFDNFRYIYESRPLDWEYFK